MKGLKLTGWVLGAGVYAALFAEVFLRVFAPQAFIPRHVVAAEYGVRMNQPSKVYRQHTPETVATIEMNSQGLRARQNYSLKKPDGIKRIAIFGDSYFLGFEVNLEDSFAWHLEQNMRAAGCPVEVLNFAVSGFGTAEMLRTLEERGLGFEPDAVIFSWHHTDPADNMRSGLYKIDDSGLQPTNARYVPTTGVQEKLSKIPFYEPLSSTSHLYIALREKGGRLIKNILTGGAVVTKEASKLETLEQPNDRPPASPLDLGLIALAKKTSEAANASFYLLDIPTVQNRTWFRSGFRLLPQKLIDADYTVSPMAQFEAEKSPDEKLYWEKGHRHLTPKGNRLLAAEMADRLRAAQGNDLNCHAAQKAARL